MAWPTAPVIIPLTAFVVAVVFVILLLIHFIRRLVGCPHQKSSYPFDHPSKHKSVLPTSPYTIDPASPNTSSSSVYYKAGLLYPALASAPSPSRSSRYDEESGNNDNTLPLDTVDRELMTDTPSPNGSNVTQENQSILVQVHSDHSDSPVPRESAPSPLSYEERSYQLVEMQRETTSTWQTDYRQSDHYESDV